MNRVVKKLPFYAWYPGDFRKDTQRLTPEERWAYRDILDEIFITNQDEGRLPDDDEYIARVVQRSVDEWKRMRYALIDGPRPLLRKRGRWIYSKRLSEEIEKARDISGKRRKARFGISSTDAEHLPDTCLQSASVSSSCSLSPEITTGEKREEGRPTDAQFGVLWASYPLKDGRKQALRHFIASVRTQADLERCATALRRYLDHLSANPWKRAKNGSTWFNNWRDWENWVEPTPPKEFNANRNDGSGNDRRPTPAGASGSPRKGRTSRDFGNQTWREVLAQSEGKLPDVQDTAAEGSDVPVR